MLIGDPIIDKHQRIFGEVVEQTVRPLVDQRQIKFKMRVGQPGRQIFDIILPRRQIISLRRCVELKNHPQLVPIGRNRLPCRRDHHPIGAVSRCSLRSGIKPAQRIDLISKKFNPDRKLRTTGRKNVQNPTPAAILARVLDNGRLFIPN